MATSYGKLDEFDPESGKDWRRLVSWPMALNLQTSNELSTKCSGGINLQDSMELVIAIPRYYMMKFHPLHHGLSFDPSSIH